VPIGLDMCVSASLPACTRSSLYGEMMDRREGKANGKSAKAAPPAPVRIAKGGRGH